MRSLFEVHWLLCAADTAADTAAEMHKCSAVKSPLGAQTVLGDRHDPICENYSQAPSAACGTRPRELSNGWRRKQIRAKHTAAKTHIVSRVRRREACPARVCKPSRSPRRRGAACLSARTCVPRRSHKSFRLRLSAHNASRGARINHSEFV